MLYQLKLRYYSLLFSSVTTGHWLNLLHTFSGGCSPGDLVEDTPAQTGYVGRIGGDCPSTVSTSCQSDTNLRNMMDYNPVQCPNHFTSGQINRMQSAWVQYRAKANSTES